MEYSDIFYVRRKHVPKSFIYSLKSSYACCFLYFFRIL